MKLVGLQKLTLLDFPNNIACCVFLGGCNFRCPFCHNSELIPLTVKETITEDEFFTFLDSRKGRIDGVAITGGEPLLSKDIKDFIIKIKAKGFKVKLDTNGAFPDRLKDLIDSNLLDYVAMDIKNRWDKYSLTTGGFKDISTIQRSIAILLEGKVDYEFRTTVIKEYHCLEDFDEIGKQIAGAQRYFIQCFQDRDSVVDKNLHPLSKDELEKCLARVKPFVKEASLRGVD